VVKRLAIAALLLCCACEEELRPESLVASMRVLGIRSSPADLHPGEIAFLDALVVDPTRPGKKSTLIWVACDPDQTNLARSACSDTAQLQDPAALQTGEVSALPPGMHLIGFGDRAVYRAPKDVFALAAPDDRRRSVGVVAQVLVVAIAEEVPPEVTRPEIEVLLEKVRNKEIRSVIAIFRIRVSEDPQRNTRPVIGPLHTGVLSLPEGAHVRLQANVKSTFVLDAPASSFEEFDQLAPDGTVQRRTERLIAAWYGSTGRFSTPRIALGESNPDITEVYTAPGSELDPLPPRRSGTLWAVVRDTRGGLDWAEFPIFICDNSPPPRVVTATVSGGTVSMTGEGLEGALDVVLGDKALRDLVYSPTTGELQGQLPVLPPGKYALSIRQRSCSADVIGPTVELK
jgi:hypothetical protein